jgi:ferredoxin
MKLVLDAERCEGHGRCYDLAAELVTAGDDGRAVFVGDGHVDRRQEPAAELAVRNCPEQALTIDRSPLIDD